MATRLPPWRLPDIIDYECFLNADEGQPAEVLHRRDRALFLEEIESTLPAPPTPANVDPKKAAVESRRALLGGWLNCRRKAELQRVGSDGQEIILPGEAFGQINAATRWALIVLGLLIGWGAATAALAYSANSEPINAFTFFVEFALAQAVILLAAFGVLAARHWFPNWKIPSLMRFLLRLAASLARNLWRKHQVRIAGSTRQNAEAVFGILRARHTLYGTVFAWTLVLLAQAFAISFNFGALGAMTTRHLFHDLDFGWESTWLSADEISRGTRIAAAPWSWALRPGHPSPAQVTGSQNRKRGAARLDAESLKSWSHFLFGAVICYGLLPRLALLAFAAYAQRAALDRLRFGDGRSALVLTRLRTPIVQTYGEHGPTTRPESAHASPTAAAITAPEPATAWPQVPRSTQAPASTAAPAATVASPVPKVEPAKPSVAAPKPADTTLPTPKPAAIEPAAPPKPATTASLPSAPAPVQATSTQLSPAKSAPVQTPLPQPTAAPAKPAPVSVAAAAPAPERKKETPPPPVPARTVFPAEPLLVLNLTGLPFDAIRAARAVGRAGADGSGPPPTAVFEAGTLALEQDAQAFAALKDQLAAAPDAEVFSLIPSWTAPMIASKLLLDQLRASAGREKLVNLVLIGRPAPDGSTKPVRPTDRELWTKAVQSRADAYLCLF